MKLLSVLIATVILFACSSQSGTYLSEDMLNDIKVNQSTKELIISKFGEPQGNTYLNNGSTQNEILVYSFSSISMGEAYVSTVSFTFESDTLRNIVRNTGNSK